LNAQAEAICSSLWDKVKRIRGVTKGMYGDDASQYEMILEGGSAN
jgi:hypothetical protein